MFYGTEQLRPSSLVEQPRGLCAPRAVLAAEHVPPPVPISDPASLAADTLLRKSPSPEELLRVMDCTQD